jgi:hypothetical protein
LEGGWLTLSAGTAPAVLVQPARSAAFLAETTVEIPAEGAAGLALFGNEANHVGLLVQDGRVRLLLRQRSEDKEVASRPLGADKTIRLRISSADGVHFHFAFATAASDWKEISGEADGDFLPQWDGAIRVGLYATRTARFDYFSLKATGSAARALSLGRE